MNVFDHHQASLRNISMMLTVASTVKLIDGRLTAIAHGHPIYAIDLADGAELRGGTTEHPKRNWSWAQQSVPYIDRPAVITYDDRRRLGSIRSNTVLVRTLAQAKDALARLDVAQVRLGDGVSAIMIARALIESGKRPAVAVIGTVEAHRFALTRLLGKAGFLVEIAYDCAKADILAREEAAWEDARQEAPELG